MSLPSIIVIILATCAATEVVAWLVHRYIMHGWGWHWHRSHHEPRTGPFERNDLYAIFFAGIAIALLVVGQLNAATAPLFWAGIGMCLYGALYTTLHDILVHQRLPIGWRPRSGYLARLVEAHHLHHACRSRDGAVSFGFLFAPPPARLRARLNARRHRSEQPPAA
jgi:beta-carotene 3-hydroxylase